MGITEDADADSLCEGTLVCQAYWRRCFSLEEIYSDFHRIGELENMILNTDAQFIANFIGIFLFSKLICITSHFSG